MTLQPRLIRLRLASLSAFACRLRHCCIHSILSSLFILGTTCYHENTLTTATSTSQNEPTVWITVQCAQAKPWRRHSSHRGEGRWRRGQDPEIGRGAGQISRPDEEDARWARQGESVIRNDIVTVQLTNRYYGATLCSLPSNKEHCAFSSKSASTNRSSRSSSNRHTIWSQPH